ncbi:MAG: DotA/TraY family protein [Alphaproteobacteria bacterium]|nr:DotA/TraY family protein [Alphaproteobacteria bacterium]
MLFSRNDKSDNKPPKKRSLFGQLFNPNVGTEIEPVFESSRMFVRMLAYILASYKLFPKDHPALENTALKLSLGDVMRTAFNRLSFTRKGIPQIILFVAVFGCLLFSALFILTLIFSALMGTAHAQTTFTSPNPDTDWALKWIDYLFLGENIKVTGALSSQPEGCEIQKAMGTALSIYSSAILVLAGFLLMYHLVFMIAEQAHTGKIMGKANQIWAPIRLVFAIGMLVPITAGSTDNSSCQVSGYNLAQYSAAQIARWGSGLGSRVWETFVTSLASQQVAVCENSSSTTSAVDTVKSPSCIKNPVNVRDLVQSLTTMEACSYFMNYYLQSGGLTKTSSTTDLSAFWFWNSSVTRGGFKVDHITDLSFNPAGSGSIKATEAYLGISGEDSSTTFADFKLKDGGKLCGGFQINPYVNSVYDQVRSVQYSALEGITQDIRTFVEDYAPYYIPNKMPDDPPQKELVEDYDGIVDALQGILDQKISKALTAADKLAQSQTVLSLSSPYFSQAGWLMAGAWFSSITKIQSTRSDAVRNAIPIFVRPTLYRLSSDSTEGYTQYLLRDVPKSAASSLSDFSAALVFSSAFPYNGMKTSNDATQFEKDMNHLTKLPAANDDILSKVFAELDKILSKFSVWNSFSVIGVKFGTTSNPLAELAAFGQSNVDVALTLFGMGIAGSVISSFLPSILSPAALVASSMITTIGSIFFTIGFTLGYIVPLYPFYRFFFGSLKWGMTVFEAIVLAPLFALAHIEPQGEGLAGKRGQYGYSVAMQLILRPALMVFGLVAGYMLFKVAVMFLNEVFVYATAGTGAYIGSVPVLAKIVYTAAYTAFVVILANQCFSTIGLFPQLALRWLGMGQVHEENIGDTQLATAAAAAAASHVSGKLPAMGKGLSEVSGGTRKAIEGKYNEGVAEKEKQKGINVAQERFEAESKQRDEQTSLLKGLADSQGGNSPPSVASESEPAAGPLPGSGGGGGAATPLVSSNYETRPGGGENQYGNMPSAGPAPNAGASKTSPSKLDKAQEDWLAKTDGGKKPPDGWNSGA